MTVKEKLSYFVEHGITIKYIAERMNVDASTLSKWLKGQKGITHKNEDKLESTLKEIMHELVSIIYEE